MNNHIISFLDFNDSKDIEITDIVIRGSIKYIHAVKILTPRFCSVCGGRMYSKGIRLRHVNHPIFQDGFKLVIVLHQRKWKCKNPLCNHYENDEFTFVEKYKRNTTLTPFLILNEMKDLNVSAASVAERFHVSDTYVHNIFLQYIDCKRLPLPEVLAIDEVYLHFDDRNKYALVLMDFMTGQIVDILPNRLQNTYRRYFQDSPVEERRKVKVIVCDMYNPYINFAPDYFYNAVTIIDSFHVIQWLLNKINKYIYQVKKRYQERDRERLMEHNEYYSTDQKSSQQSLEVYLLNNYKWILLKSQKSISSLYTRNSYTGKWHTTYEYVKMFLDLDKNFSLIRDLKERYIAFNDSFPKDAETATRELEGLISLYEDCSLAMFREFAGILKSHKQEIINSFTVYASYGDNKLYNEVIEETCAYARRISSGPMEGLNRKPKDLKRNSRGCRNIRYTINRIIWANRDNEPIRYTPKPLKEVKPVTGKKRGKYRKKKSNKQEDFSK